MGMYDYLKCDHPLPKTGYEVPVGHEFQTKSLENLLLARYTITEDGKLILHRVSLEIVPEEERPHYGTPEWHRPFGKWIGSMREVPVGDEEVPYHGDVIFHDAFRVRGEGGERLWIEFRARFTEGTLVRIEVADVHELPPTKTVEIGGEEFQATEWRLGIDVVHLGQEVEIEWDEETGA